MVWRFLFGLCSRITECIYSKKIVLFDYETVHKFVSAIVKEKRSYRDDMILSHMNAKIQCYYISVH